MGEEGPGTGPMETLHELALLWNAIVDAGRSRSALITATEALCEAYPWLKPAARLAERQ